MMGTHCNVFLCNLCVTFGYRYEFVALTDDELTSVDEALAIRGFKVVRKQAKTYEHTDAGTFQHTGEVTFECVV